MPTRPQVYRPHSHAPATQQGAGSTHVYKHKTTTERGYGYAWQQARIPFLRDNPVCVRCEQSGIFTPATVVDHIIPHRGDMTLFWDSDNWQTLCKSCHDKKTNREDKQFAYQGLGRGMVTLVCGPPGAGKTTHVRQAMSAGDLILDLDTIWEALSGQPMYTKPDSLLPYVLNVRDLLIQRLASDEARPRAWVITMGASREERRDLCRRLKAKCVVITTPIDTCIQRISADQRRQSKLPMWIALVERWWQQYEPDPCTPQG